MNCFWVKHMVKHKVKRHVLAIRRSLHRSGLTGGWGPPEQWAQGSLQYVEGSNLDHSCGGWGISPPFFEKHCKDYHNIDYAGWSLLGCEVGWPL